MCFPFWNDEVDSAYTKMEDFTCYTLLKMTWVLFIFKITCHTCVKLKRTPTDIENLLNEEDETVENGKDNSKKIRDANNILFGSGKTIKKSLEQLEIEETQNMALALNDLRYVNIIRSFWLVFTLWLRKIFQCLCCDES